MIRRFTIIVGLFLWFISAEQAVAASDTATAKRLVAYSEASAAAGRKWFLLKCTACHGQDGKARIDFVSDATDLTDPERWRNGITQADVYRSLTEGAGYDMPPFKYQITDEKKIWHLINWIISTWTEEQRNALLAGQ